MSATSIEQAVANVINESSPAMQLAQVGAKIKESLDSIVASLAEPPVWDSTFTGASGKQVYYGNKLWISNASVVGGDVPGVSAKWDAAGTGGGGGGASAYPDTVTYHTTASETVTLTTGDQGVHLASATGIIYDLPSVAADGVIFKFIATQYTSTINTNGVGSIFYPMLNATAKVVTGRPLYFMAANVAGIGLVWVLLNVGSASTYDAAVTYNIGEIVVQSAIQYMCIQALNTNNSPVASSSWWMPLVAINQATGNNSMSDADVTMDGTAATGVVVSYAYKKATNNLTHIGVSIAASGAGATNTQIVVAMLTYLGSPYNLPGPSLKEPGLATINGGAIVCPCFWQTTNDTIVINLPSAIAFLNAEIRFAF